ncbi:hypothetical protein BCR33DRAFT_275453 [Rhizoclosmatium globosum]|uniref:1-alkyl-2-acetylglycerophosphocholine esterase n=1 Tax=Rhizoclosmatium globosum TaxID=329046 RepID=A0A1Y2ADD5_9FUNG|nr:hypothetical protein BCR33DRAFT_275453 [Rhizoclosmatium globosum]|eukprot:ORY19995.1 hypothetical protein BCR33DRAFT_275453 [Rhizoclosmatium globosum]
MASIFYPADSSYSRQAPKAKWLHGPSKFYAVGYGTYARLPPWFSKTVLSWTLSQVQMPARAEAPFITTKEQPFKSPVVIFCHGLAGNSTTVRMPPFVMTNVLISKSNSVFYILWISGQSWIRSFID